MNPDVIVHMVFKLRNDNTLDFSGKDSSSGDPAKASFDSEGNVDVGHGYTAWLNFELSPEDCEGVWYFSRLDIKDKDVDDWEGKGGGNALNPSEEADYSVLDIAVPIDQKTGMVNFPYDRHVVGFTLQDLNKNVSTLDYRVYCKDRHGKTLTLDPRVRDSGGSD